MAKRSNKSLTSEDIDAIKDDELIFAVLEQIGSTLPSDVENHFATVISWPKELQAIFLIWGLEAEVNNGGFNQYYFNPTGHYYELVPDALAFIGAHKFSDLVTRANATYESRYDAITKEQDGTLEGFMRSYGENPLKKYDDEFQELYLVEDLYRLQVELIRKNKSVFVSDIIDSRSWEN